MKLTKKNSLIQKVETKVTPTGVTKISPSDIDFKAIISVGKYKDYTFSWLKENDTSYYNWIIDNNLIEKWSLYKSERQETKKKHNHFVSSSGQIWIDLRLVENVTGNYSPFL